MWAWRACVGLALALALCACGPRAKDLKPGEQGEVARVVDGDSIELKDGLRTHLVGVTAPREEPWAGRARAALERLCLEREIQLFYGETPRLAPSERYPREAALAHLFVRSEGGRWVWAQEILLREGVVQVHTRKDNVARAERMLAAEAIARQEKRGVWAERRYAIRDANRPMEPQGFAIVEGMVRSVGDRGERIYLNFGMDYRTDFTVLILREDLAGFPPAFDPNDLANRTIRVRGFLSDRGGPLIRVDHAAQIEVIA